MPNEGVKFMYFRWIQSANLWKSKSGRFCHRGSLKTGKESIMANSCKQATIQFNWNPPEEKTHAIVTKLRNGQDGSDSKTVFVKWPTFNGSLGHRIRRKTVCSTDLACQMNETSSQFNKAVKYNPGKDKIVADTISRYAYPESSSRD